MGKIIFITGGARSGKSALAVEIAKEISGGRVAFVATCRPQDAEMKRRVTAHRKKRPASWRTIEASDDLLKALKKVTPRFKVAIVDCLTLFVSGLLMKGAEEREIVKGIRAIAAALVKAPHTTIIVSNEVGSGVVPENLLGREFRDAAGLANQIMAESAEEAYFVVAGIPLKLK